MRNVSRFAIATTLLLYLGTASAQLITNGTFDTNASGWHLFSSCGDAVWDNAGNPPGGIRLNSCGQGDSDPTAAQTIHNLVIGQTYTVSVDVHLFTDSSGDGTGKSFGVFLDAEPANPLVLTEFLDDNWHTVTTTFVATNNSATLIFAGELDARTPGGPGQNTDVAYYIDNVVVTGPVGQPIPMMSNAALALMALRLMACSGLVLRVRLRR